MTTEAVMPIPVPSDIRDENWFVNWLKQENDVANIHKFYIEVIVPEYNDLIEILPQEKGWFERSNRNYMELYNKIKPKWSWFRKTPPSNDDLETLKGYVSMFVNRAQYLRTNSEAPFRKLAQVNRDRHDDYNERCEQCFNNIGILQNQVHELEKQLNPTKTYKSYSIFSPPNFVPNKSEGGRSKRSKRSKRVKRSKRSSTKRH